MVASLDRLGAVGNTAWGKTGCTAACLSGRQAASGSCHRWDGRQSREAVVHWLLAFTGCLRLASYAIGGPAIAAVAFPACDKDSSGISQSLVKAGSPEREPGEGWWHGSEVPRPMKSQYLTGERCRLDRELSSADWSEGSPT